MTSVTFFCYDGGSKILEVLFLPCSETLVACDSNWWGITAFFLALISNNGLTCGILMKKKYEPEVRESQNV